MLVLNSLKFVEYFVFVISGAIIYVPISKLLRTLFNFFFKLKKANI